VDDRVNDNIERKLLTCMPICSRLLKKTCDFGKKLRGMAVHFIHRLSDPPNKVLTNFVGKREPACLTSITLSYIPVKGSLWDKLHV
jgi:hypothetical protein